MVVEHRSTFEPDAQCRTQMHLARQGIVSPEMERVGQREGSSRARPRRVARGA